ncbi:MAG: AIM24 family protein [Clostridiales bacterium]|nr:AIM24 family protein [Clostridiales bacterium]
MITLNNLAENQNMKVIAEQGIYTVFEHQKDMSVSPEYSSVAYFMHEMNVRKRQVLCRMNNSAVKLQAGAMQWTAGQVDSSTGVKGVGDFLGKALKGAVTNESAVKPLYQGSGFLMLEPTYRYIILEDVSQWGSGIVLDDGLFLACDASLQEKVVARSNVSSALLGGEGLFNLSLSGCGIAVLESPVPREELIEIVVQDDVVKIDGNMAIAWSNSLQFTVEKSSKSLMGSALNGEGFVNVYRGTGRILLAPTVNGTTMSTSNGPKNSNTTSSKGLVSSVVKSALDL